MTPLLTVSNVSRDFIKSLDLVAKFLNRLGQNHREEIVHAVDDVSLKVFKGEVVGIVGESGCGKSTLGKMVAGILTPSEGQVRFQSADKSHNRPPDDLKTQMIFQDPFSSLNPRKKVIEIVTEAPIHHGLIKASEKREFALEMLNRVGLDAEALGRYPHQFSGGQRQRIGIARALAVSPELLVCDESIAALDVSIQAQVLNLFVKLKQDYNLTYLFISHDIGVIEHISDRVIVMYLGRMSRQRQSRPLLNSLTIPTLRRSSKVFPDLKLASVTMNRSAARFHHRSTRLQGAISTRDASTAQSVARLSDQH